MPDAARDATTETTGPGEPEIMIATEGAAGIITLNRPRALQALNAAMRTAMADALARFARDPEIYGVIFCSSGGKAFCAGGDVRELANWIKSDPARALAATADEYRLIWQIECFPKPILSLIDGLVMGSGAGISTFGTHRVAAERYAFAMPETALGFFPDVGATYFLSRLPGAIGAYLGLTGEQVGRADALALGLATHCIRAEEFGAIRAALAAADPIDAVLDALHRDPGEGLIAPLQPVIDRCFSAPTVAEILQRFAAERGAHEAWAKSTLTRLQARSPRSLAVTLHQMRLGRGLPIKVALELEYRLATRMLFAPDFREGVRALLVDRDGAARWQPQSLQDVRAEDVEALFARLPEGELELPPRAKPPVVEG